jgi:hypothetical protein
MSFINNEIKNQSLIKDWKRKKNKMQEMLEIRFKRFQKEVIDDLNEFFIESKYYRKDKEVKKKDVEEEKNYSEQEKL